MHVKIYLFDVVLAMVVVLMFGVVLYSITAQDTTTRLLCDVMTDNVIDQIRCGIYY